MMIRILLILILFVSFSSGKSDTHNTVYEFDLNKTKQIAISNWKYHFGDLENGTLSELDDTKWQAIHRRTFRKEESGVHWFRTKIIVKGNENMQDDVIIWISKLPSAFEVYWDGELIGQNGKVAQTIQEEIPGNYIFYKKIPKKFFSTEDHYLTIKVSNYHGELFFQGYTSFFTILSYYSVWFDQYSNSINIHYFNIGLLLITFLLSFSLFMVGGRNKSYLFIGIFCLVELLFHLSFIVVYLKMINIQKIDYIYLIRNTSYFFECILVNLFLIYKYKIPKRYFHITAVIFISILLEYLFKSQILFTSLRHIILYGYATGIMIYVSFMKKSGAIITLVGVMALFILNIFYKYIQLFGLFGLNHMPPFIIELAYIIFISSIILATTKQIRGQYREHERAKNLSQRLEMELLKRNIKPHFILNTLFSIISLIRKEPGKAIKMIHALAEEFQIVNRISSKKLISIEEEIKLCNKHLQIMEFRRNANYRFETFGINNEEKIPPMIFHTMIENGLTHSYQIGENGVFKLFFKRTGKTAQYIFQNGGSKLKHSDTRSSDDIEAGTGLNYVKARLNESFENEWELSYGLNNGFWEVKINIGK